MGGKKKRATDPDVHHSDSENRGLYMCKLGKYVILFALLALFVGVGQPTWAAPQASSALALAAPDDWTPQCTPTEVAVYESRIHVRCEEGVSDGSAMIYFWAVPTTKPEFANRFLSIGSTALVAGRYLVFLYTPGDTSGADFGCLDACRNVYAIALQ